MKYRILIRTVNINVVSHNWLLTGVNPWETEDKQEALDKYQDLLDSYSSGDLTLIQVVPVNITLSTDTMPDESEDTDPPAEPEPNPDPNNP